jgi:hypothetical protein
MDIRATTMAREIIDSILVDVKPRGAPTTAERRKLLVKNDEYVFTTQNASLKVSLYMLFFSPNEG